MKKIQYIILSLALIIVATSANAQKESDTPSGTLSPYSQMGLGLLSEPQTGFNAGMNNISIGMRGHADVNTGNPASYSAVDSLSFIFDAGVSGQITNFSQNGNKINRKSACIDYVVALFRVTKGLGVSFGFQPYSQVGYDYKEIKYINDNPTQQYANYYHARQGGIQQYYVGFGWSPVKYVSIGANGAYFHGDIDRYVYNTSADETTDKYTKSYEINISSYKLDAGLQVMIPIGKRDQLTLGGTYGFGHKLNADQNLYYIHTTTATSELDTVKYVAQNAFSIPHTFGAGISYQHGSKWRIGVDASLQKWSYLKYPVFKEGNNGTKGFVMSDNYFVDRKRLAIGGEYCYNDMSRNFFDRIRYRLGASYTTPYYNIGSNKGPREISVSAGLAIPIINGYNNRSIVNVAFQWVNTEAASLIKENTFRLKIGFTFNERWFMTWKVG